MYRPISSPFSKIGAVCLVSALYGSCTGGLSSLIWLKISRETFTWISIYKFIAACVAAVIIFTLIYEILFLSKERELDTKIVDQLDKELSQAELQVLTNEIDLILFSIHSTRLTILFLTSPNRRICSITGWHRFINIS